MTDTRNTGYAHRVRRQRRKYIHGVYAGRRDLWCDVSVGVFSKGILQNKQDRVSQKLFPPPEQVFPAKSQPEKNTTQSISPSISDVSPLELNQVALARLLLLLLPGGEWVAATHA